MAYGDVAYESVANAPGNPQTLTANARTLLKIDEVGPPGMVTKFADRRWDKTNSLIRGQYADEKLELRYTTTFTPGSLLAAPFALKWEFDIGGTFNTIATDWWDYPSLLGVTLLVNASRTKSAALPFYVGPTWIANGCKIYVTAVNAGCTLTSSALLISRVG